MKILSSGIIFSMCTLFSAQPAWAALTIYVSTLANAEVSYKKLKSYPSTLVTVTQAISLLNAPELRDANGGHEIRTFS